jgi:hypothetical protein
MAARCLILLLLGLSSAVQASAQEDGAATAAVRESDLSTLERARIRTEELGRNAPLEDLPSIEQEIPDRNAGIDDAGVPTPENT